MSYTHTWTNLSGQCGSDQALLWEQETFDAEPAAARTALGPLGAREAHGEVFTLFTASQTAMVRVHSDRLAPDGLWQYVSNLASALYRLSGRRWLPCVGKPEVVVKDEEEEEGFCGLLRCIQDISSPVLN